MRQKVLRHCMVVHAYYPHEETRVQREAEALIDQGFNVDVICLRFPTDSKFEDVFGVKVYRLPVQRNYGTGIIKQFLEYLAFFFLAFWQLCILHIKRRYDVVQVHNLPDFLVFSALFPRLMGAKVILDLHDLMPEFFLSRFKGTKDSRAFKIIRLQERLACWFANHVITVTEYWRQSLVQRGLSPEKCSVVMNLADNRIFKKDNFNDSSPKQRNYFNLFYHGTLTYRYGIDLLLQAVARIRIDIPNVRLTIHGDGDYLVHLKELSRELKVEDLVHFSTINLPAEKLTGLILDADVCFVPYRRDIFTDGILPTKLMEYATLEMPTIVACTPVISQYFDGTMVQFFEAGNLEELANQILYLFLNPAKRDELAQNLKRFNQQYNWKKQKLEYVKLIERLAEG